MEGLFYTLPGQSNYCMQKRILVYGGYGLTNQHIEFIKELVKELVTDPSVIIMTGGFDHYTEGERKNMVSVDRAVLDASKLYIKEGFENRFETWHTTDNDSKKQSFKEGNIIPVHGSRQVRRFRMVNNCDVVITIQGNDNTKSIIELALAINKPILPLPFTGGKSETLWPEYRDDVKKLIENIPGKDDILTTIEKIPGTDWNHLAKPIADFLKKVAEKKCLVLMPFDKKHNERFDIFKTAIEKNGFITDRIDKSEVAGDIPDIFKEKLDNSKAVIVDITDFNPNVLYELGYVHSKKITPLIISGNAEANNIAATEFPFYLKQAMIIVATGDDTGRKRIDEAIKKYLEQAGQ